MAACPSRGNPAVDGAAALLASLVAIGIAGLFAPESATGEAASAVPVQNRAINRREAFISFASGQDLQRGQAALDA